MSEKIGLESASINVMGVGDINPATITFIAVPDYDYSFSGSISLGGSASAVSFISKHLESSWSIRGTFKSGFSSDWQVGDGGYYWYRVEGSCGESRCDTTGIKHSSCNNMTFMTVVGARNLSELCQKLANPIINPKIDFRLSSIKKYSRPVERSSSEDCNSLSEQEFCNVAECLDYCLDQRVTHNIPLSMRAIESSFFAEMTGSVNFGGQVQTDRNKTHIPEFPVIGISGSSKFLVSLHPSLSAGNIVISGASKIVSNYHSFEGSGLIFIGGFARTVSPSRSYSASPHQIQLSGSSRLSYSPNLKSTVQISGSALELLRMKFVPTGKIELGGRLVDYTSPTFFSSSTGNIDVSGEASFNFTNRGIVSENFGLSMKAFDFGSESSLLNSSSFLTIADQTISPSCGCGPLALSLTLRHNMPNSSYLSDFLKRSGLTMSDSLSLRYRSSDSSWRHAQNFSGRGKDGFSKEEISMLYSMSCSGGFWIFSFSAVNLNKSIGKELHTKFILDIPSDLICSDGSISTVIGLDIKNGGFQQGSGKSFSAVDPPVFTGRNPQPRSVDVYVDGVFNDKRLYYDDVGLFKNKYWNANRLEMSINTPPGTKMPELQAYRIFT